MNSLTDIPTKTTPVETRKVSFDTIKEQAPNEDLQRLELMIYEMLRCYQATKVKFDMSAYEDIKPPVMGIAEIQLVKELRDLMKKLGLDKFVKEVDWAQNRNPEMPEFVLWPDKAGPLIRIMLRVEFHKCRTLLLGTDDAEAGKMAVTRTDAQLKEDVITRSATTWDRLFKNCVKEVFPEQKRPEQPDSPSSDDTSKSEKRQVSLDSINEKAPLPNMGRLELMIHDMLECYEGITAEFKGGSQGLAAGESEQEMLDELWKLFPRLGMKNFVNELNDGFDACVEKNGDWEPKASVLLRVLLLDPRLHNNYGQGSAVENVEAVLRGLGPWGGIISKWTKQWRELLANNAKVVYPELEFQSHQTARSRRGSR